MYLGIKICFLLAAWSVNARPGSHSTGKAVYVLTNNANNAVIGLPIYKNGLLGEGQVTTTGGTGQNGLNSTQDPAGPDSLFSQGAVAVAGQYVFAVNPGSNTISMLKPDHANPSKLTLVGQPALIPGDFPNSVAASSKSRLVCVGTTGTRAGVSCTTYGHGGLGKMDELRLFELNQSTPPIGPPNTLSHVFFSADESALFVAVKGDGSTNNLGFFSVFPVQYGCTSDTAASLVREDVRSSLNGTGLLFGATISPDSGRVFATDPGFGVAVLEVERHTHKAALVSRVVVPGQAAICWAAYSAETDSVFVTDVAVNRLVEIDANDGSILLTANLPNDDPGLIDLQVVGTHVYALSPGNGTTEAAITVFDIGKEQQVQHVSLAKFGANRNAMGMAYIDL
ncbi:hypothetical protein BDW59DRAFT_178358 [Aspergillus cavernicola]|uniref:3-carboxymuconate cyclase n=1 Tax=Aspergillus cavernicola TaxID=176166 RepID=A0ABR4HC79_9EURO